MDDGGESSQGSSVVITGVKPAPPPSLLSAHGTVATFKGKKVQRAKNPDRVFRIPLDVCRQGARPAGSEGWPDAAAVDMIEVCDQFRDMEGRGICLHDLLGLVISLKREAGKVEDLLETWIGDLAEAGDLW